MFLLLPIWIQSVRPKYVILSTGGRHGHPTKKAYQSFHYGGLARVAPHSVFVGGISENKVINHITTAGIFSTLPHGDIKVVFPTEEKIKIMPQNSRTKVFEEGEDVNKKFQSDVKNLPPEIKEENVELVTGDIRDIPDPESYEVLMAKFKVQQHGIVPLLIDLNDPHNQFILEYFKYHNIKVDDQTIVKLNINDKLVGEVSISIPDEEDENTTLTIDLKDPRNIHLAREVNWIRQASNTTTTTTTTTTTLQEEKSEEHERGKKEKRKKTEKKSSEEESLEEKEIKKPRLDVNEPTYNRDNLSKFLNYLLSGKNMKAGDITKKLKKDGFNGATIATQLGKIRDSDYHPNGKYEELWNALKKSFKDDFEACWPKTKEAQ